MIEPKILITGGNGKLATEIRKNYNCVNPPKQELDVTNFVQVNEYLKHHTDIEFIIHAGAITSVEKCENEKELAYNVNVNGTKNVIKAIQEQKRKIKLIYISTPCVFDGKTGNYDEDSLPHPENYYGLTKTISEELIKNSGIQHVIIRTNFVPREKWAYPKAFIDRYGTYLFADQVANHLGYHINNSEGIVHLVGKDKLSMFELAQITTPKVKPMPYRHYKGNARLTIDMTMVSKRNYSYSIKDKY